jgi:molybdate transport system regulatory protein
MKHGARNRIVAKVRSVEKGSVMALVKVRAKGTFDLASVLTKESVEELKLKKGDEVLLVVKAIHVLLAKE